MFKGTNLHGIKHRRKPASVARQLLPLIAAALLAGCGRGEELGTVGYVEGFLGAVAGDEPRAALIGRDVLSAGGSAGDAVVAMAFAAAVTLPSSAGLGGGGVCLGFNAATGQVAAIDFTARAPLTVPPEADRPAAVPGFARGLFAFHARYGRLAWSQLLGPAEQLARFGTRVSRAFAQDVAALERALLDDPETRRVFAAPDGDRLVGEGSTLRQVELAAVLARIRAEGAGAFYTGAFARDFAEAATAAGGGLSVEDLRDYRPALVPTITLPVGSNVAHFAAPPAAGGALAAQIWGLLADEFGRASPAERLALIAAAGQATEADRDRWQQADGSSSVPPQDLVAASRLRSLMVGGRAATDVSGGAATPRVENPAAATFVAADREGSAAVCAFTLNGLFGTGRVAPGTGVLLAAAPGPGGRGATALGPMLIVNENIKAFFFAGAAAGGIAAPSALAGVALRVMEGDESLTAAVGAVRVLGTRVADRIYYESLNGGFVREALGGRGDRLVEVPTLGRVNAIACLGGIPRNPETCSQANDPRGHGLSVGAD